MGRPRSHFADKAAEYDRPWVWSEDACKELSVTGHWRGSCSGGYPDKGHRGRSGWVGAGRERSARHRVVEDLWPRLARGGVGDRRAGLPCRAETDSMSLDKPGEIGYYTKRMVQDSGFRIQDSVVSSQESGFRIQEKTSTTRHPGRAWRQTALLPLDKMSLRKGKGRTQ